MVLAGRRFVSAGSATAAAAATACLVLLPFFVLAPRQMWQMVVADQLGRHNHGDTSTFDRLGTAIGGRHLGLSTPAEHALVLLATLAFAVAVVMCLRDPVARTVAVVALCCVAILMRTPVVFAHYGDLTAASVAATIRIGLSRLRLPSVTARRVTSAAGALVILADRLTSDLHAGCEVAVDGRAGADHSGLGRLVLFEKHVRVITPTADAQQAGLG